MKNYKLLLAGVVCGSVMLFNLAAKADNDKPGVVTVTGLQGPAQYSIDGGQTWTPLVLGKVLGAGSVIQTGDKSIVAILVGKTSSDETAEFLLHNPRASSIPNSLPREERNTITLRPKTTLGIDKLSVSDATSSEVSDAELNLKKGRIFASVKKVSPSSQYFIKIPDGVAAVRGTEIELDTDGGPTTSVSVSSGTVWLTFSVVDANGNPVNAPGGGPLQPVQVTIPAGDTFTITPALLAQVIQTVQGLPAGTAPTAAQQQLNTQVQAIVSALSPSVVTVLQNVFAPSVTVTVSQTAPANPPSSPSTAQTITPVTTSSTTTTTTSTTTQPTSTVQ
jgi:hypothetical protein